MDENRRMDYERRLSENGWITYIPKQEGSPILKISRTIIFDEEGGMVPYRIIKDDDGEQNILQEDSLRFHKEGHFDKTSTLNDSELEELATRLVQEINSNPEKYK